MNCLCNKCQFSENNKNDILTNIKSHHKPSRSKNISFQNIPFNINDYIPEFKIQNHSKKDNIRIEKYNNDKDYLEIIEYPELKLKSNKSSLILNNGLNLKNNAINFKNENKNKILKIESLNIEDDIEDNIEDKITENETMTIRKFDNFPYQNEDYLNEKKKTFLELRKEIEKRNKNRFQVKSEKKILNNYTKGINMYSYKNNSISSNIYKNSTTCSDLNNHKNNSIKIENKDIEDQVSIISSD